MLCQLGVQSVIQVGFSCSLYSIIGYYKILGIIPCASTVSPCYLPILYAIAYICLSRTNLSPPPLVTSSLVSVFVSTFRLPIMGTKKVTLGWYQQLNCWWCSNVCSCFTDSSSGAGFMLHWPILSSYTPPTCDNSLVLPRLLWPCYFQKVLVRHLSGICSEFVLFPHN